MKRTIAFAFAAVILLSLSTAALAAETIKNWSAPSTWTPPSAQAKGRSALVVTYPPVPFIPITPCRIADTRNPAGPYGAPALAGGVPRNFTLTGQCGIGLTAQAVSLNITVVNTLGPGFILIYPQGGVQPGVSTLNYVAGQTVANAAVVPLGTGGGVTVVAGVSGTDLIIDVNGYYASNVGASTFVISSTAGYAVIGTSSTGVGVWGLGLTYGVFGQSTGTGFGVYGLSSAGIGVNGLSSTNVGTKGFSTSYNGVWAESTSQDGLFASGGREGAFISGARNGAIIVTSGTTSDTAGVFGKDGTGAGSTGFGYFSAGVRGEGQNGVIGITNTSGGDGVIGRATSPALVGVRTDGNFTATGTKAFVEPHPSDPMLTIRYVALEGPEAGTYFRGTAKTLNREAVIPVPDSFRIVTAEEGLTVQLTPAGELAQMAVMSQDLNQIVVRSSREVTFHYHVNGIRRAFKDWQAVTEGHEFRPVSPDQKMPTYLSEEAKSRLIANGTYNPDGTVNMNTAERLGWAQKWRDDEARAKAAKAAQEAAAAKAK
ncbi:MAG TPA: hypothetical protein VGS00_08335 [Thermoanaerobaculia bacterium]|nr:hypothetical protein [Thermoanaerobaculia bacterium]